ncbi:MAG: hypothetical protein GY928_32910 [Colwellia sp.]|nr:hypothetical protein [Colwellia sp.]
MLLKNRKKILLLTIFIVTCIVTLVAGLWPFFWPKNAVEWISDKNGISFYGTGIAYTPDVFSSVTQNLSQSGNSLSIELWLQSRVKPMKHLNHWHIARWHYAQILSLYTNGNSREFEIAQRKSDLVICSRSSNEKIITLQNAISFDKIQFITITSGTDGTTIYLDGKLVKFYQKYPLIAENKMISGKLLLGNAPDMEYPWTGKLFGLAIYDRLLTSEEVQQNYRAWSEHRVPLPSKKKGPLIQYLLDEHHGTLAHNSSSHQYNLLIPKTFQEFRQKDLFQSWKEFRPKSFGNKDFFVNVLGFIPFGFFLSAYLYNAKNPSRYHIYLITISLGIGISLAIEILQIYIPTRSPSLIDLTNNILGTAIGAVLLNTLITLKKPGTFEKRT